MRSDREQLQLALGDRGRVLEYVRHTRPDRRYPGWWVQPTHDYGDECGWCQAARNGTPLYAGYHSRDALERVGVWKHAHRAAETTA